MVISESDIIWYEQRASADAGVDLLATDALQYPLVGY